MPETRGHHVLDGPFLSVGQFDLDYLFADAWPLAASWAWLFFTFTWALTAYRARLFRFFFTLARMATAFRAWVWFHGFAVPLWIVEVIVGFYKIIDREIVLAVKESRAASDDLLELNHGVYRAHQNDIADIAGIHAGRKFLRCGKDGGDGFFVVLEIPQMLFAQLAVVGCDTLAIVWVGAGFHLIDQITDSKGVVLGGAKDQGFFPLVDL